VTACSKASVASGVGQLPFDLGRQRAAGRGVAARTAQAVQLVFHDVGHDDRQLSDLMTPGVWGRDPPGAGRNAGRSWDGKGMIWRTWSASTSSRCRRGMARLAAVVLAGLLGWWRWATFHMKAV